MTKLMSKAVIVALVGAFAAGSVALANNHDKKAKHDKKSAKTEKHEKHDGETHGAEAEHKGEGAQ